MDTIFQLPSDTTSDLQRFGQEIEKFAGGRSSAAEFRVFRVPRGVYEQRENDTYMLRVRCPAGMVLPHQMRALAGAATRYGSGVLHVTTRQDIQIHRVVLNEIYPALVELDAAGLSTKGGGGNTVRNITGCVDAGVCGREAFDVTPYVVDVTERLLPDPLSYQLPRKYKLAFSGCDRDCAGATVNDVGFVAVVRGGQRGFAVYVGGGMGASSRVAARLEEFIPAEEAYLTAEAVKRVFDQHGDRRNRHRARIRFLVETIGLEKFRDLYRAELATLRGAGASPTTIREVRRETRSPGSQRGTPDAAFFLWRKRYVVAQKQAGSFLVHIPLFLGDIEAGRFVSLADVVTAHGEGVLRGTPRQNLVMRWVPEGELPELYERLKAIGLAGDQSPVLGNLVACAGAATCRLGICLARGLAAAIRDELSREGAGLDELGPLAINISGCPNSCGRHPVADIGLFGAARRAHGRLAPHYTLQWGGRVGVGRTRLAEGEQVIPARNVPALVAEILAAFRRSEHYPDFGRFVDVQRASLEKTLVAKHLAVPETAADDRFHVDWGASAPFSLAGRGPGECGAGVFDLIDIDLESARDALQNGRLLEATVLAARALLVTRGELAASEVEALELFTRLFLDDGAVEPSVGVLIGAAKVALRVPQAGEALSAEEVGRFLARIERLYADMGASLRFKPSSQPSAALAASPPPPAALDTQSAGPGADREADFRGVVCPLNYVKTKMLLATMPAGGVLDVLLDEPGSRNVPASVEKDGHRVRSVDREGDYWRVRVEKCWSPRRRWRS